MSLWKPLAVIALSFAFVAGLYYGIQSYFAGIGGGGVARAPRAPAWPPPPAGSTPHPLWRSLDQLWGTARGARIETLRRLLALPPDRLPHPSRMPDHWPAPARARVRAILTRLHAGLPHRAHGLELRIVLDRAPVAGAASGVRVALACGSAGTRWASTIAPTLAEHLLIGGPGGGFVPAERPPGDEPRAVRPDTTPKPGKGVPEKGEPVAGPPSRYDVVVPSRFLAAGAFERPGHTSLVVAADLTDWPNAPTRWGPGPHLLISNRIVVDVKPLSASPADKSSR